MRWSEGRSTLTLLRSPPRPKPASFSRWRPRCTLGSLIALAVPVGEPRESSSLGSFQQPLTHRQRVAFVRGSSPDAVELLHWQQSCHQCSPCQQQVQQQTLTCARPACCCLCMRASGVLARCEAPFSGSMYRTPCQVHAPCCRPLVECRDILQVPALLDSLKCCLLLTEPAAAGASGNGSVDSHVVTWMNSAAHMLFQPEPVTGPGSSRGGRHGRQRTGGPVPLSSLVAHPHVLNLRVSQGLPARTGSTHSHLCPDR